MKLNRKWLMVIALVLSMTMAISGTLAYLTDRDTAVNTFTMGNVDIELNEDYVQDSELAPGVAVDKVAGITNIHKSEPAYVWMVVSVPTDLAPHIELDWAGNYTATEVASPHTGYTGYLVKYPDELAAGKATGAILEKVMLKANVDFQNGKYVAVNGGTVTEIGDVNIRNIMVDAYAIQTDGFADVDAAYDAYIGQWNGLNGGMSNPIIDVPENAVKVKDAAELAAAVADGATVLELAPGEYNVYGCAGKTLSLYGTKDVVLKLYNDGEDGCDYSFGGNGTGVGNVTFNGITIDTTANTGNYKGYAYMRGTFNGCSFVGAYSLNNANDFEFNYCDFDFKNGYFWTWGANSVTFNNCTFNDNGNSKCILAHGYASTNITINDCKFAATEVGKTGAGDPTACVEIDPAGTNTYTINFTGYNTKTDKYVGWTRVKDASTGHVITGV